jgi:hypothetical protein
VRFKETRVPWPGTDATATLVGATLGAELRGA